jgi:phospholipid N-methyltransferase
MPPDARNERTPRERPRAIARPWSGQDLAPEAPKVPLDESFLAHFLRAPALVGGIVPSSPVLARALSRHATGYDAIVELGAGEGSVTRRLAADHPHARLTLIERSATMAGRLERGWPRADVHAGCVHERADRIYAMPRRTVAVSSLPFRSLPAELAQATIAVLQRFLLDHSERTLVQYSYGLREPFAFDAPSIAWRRAERVWRNLPPAVVWIAGAKRVANGA